MRVCTCASRVPSSCTGPQGQACVDWVFSTHSSLVESERNPHRWLSTFKKSRLHETCQLRFKFLLLVAVTLQYSSNICLPLHPPLPTYRSNNPTKPPPTSPPNPQIKATENTAACRHLKMCFLMSAQTAEQEPALVIHHHKLLVPT